MAQTSISALQMALFERLAREARPLDDDDWGSDRQIEASNRFFTAIGDLGDSFGRWCLKATDDEMLDEALRLLRLRVQGKALQVGDRVRLKRTIIPYPLGLFWAGATGIVTDARPDATETNPVAYVLLDVRFPSLDDWDNVLQVYRSGDHTSEVTEDLFEVIP